MGKRGKKDTRRKKKRSSKFWIKKFFFWFISYTIIIFIFTSILKETQIYENKIGFYLIMGFVLIILSRIVYSARHKRNFNLRRILPWGFIYVFVFGIVDYTLNLFPKVQINPSYDLYLNLLIFSAIFTLCIMFVRRMNIRGKKRSKNVFMRAPSQIMSGIILLIISLLFFRFSHIIFLDWFNWPEGMAWSWLIGFGFLIFGILTLIAWWRNNVLSQGKHFGLKIHH